MLRGMPGVFVMAPFFSSTASLPLIALAFTLASSAISMMVGEYPFWATKLRMNASVLACAGVSSLFVFIGVHLGLAGRFQLAR